MRGPGRHKEELAGPQGEAVAGQAGQVRAGPEHGVQAGVKCGVEFPGNLRGVEGPLLLSREEIHPEVRTESVNMKTTVSAGLETYLTRNEKNPGVLPSL